MKNKAVIIFGPPGSGKGTQAELLAKKFNFIHFDTGRYLENLIYSPNALKDPILKKQKENFESGKLFSPLWVLKKVKEATKKIAAADKGIVYSGSPRTIIEAFGNKNQKGLMSLLEKLYGKKNILIFKLNVPQKSSIKRNSQRLICSVCGLPILATAKINRCAFCYGPLRKRTLDKPEVIKVRLKEYKKNSFPIFKELKKQGYKIFNINAQVWPYQIFKNISRFINFSK